jgi:hypothetical protein
MSLKTTEPTKFRWVCVHGRTLDEVCRQCDIARAQAVINQWGDEVDRARQVVGNRSLFNELLEGIEELGRLARTRS